MTLDLKGRRGRGPVKGPLSTEGQHSNWRWARERAASPAFWSLHFFLVVESGCLGIVKGFQSSLFYAVYFLKCQL
jgi:hypothetical protein